MGDSTPATTNTSSSSSPWSAATPLLQSLISRYGGMSTDVTGNQSSALGNLWNSASGIPNFGSTAATGVNKLFNSDTSPQVGMLGQGYDSLKANLGSTADGSHLNPYNTPGFSDAISTMGDDITNRVKGVYAGSGREPAGAGSFGQSLGRGLAQGEAPVIASQFNANKGNQMDAAKSLFSGAGSTATGEANLGQLPMQNILQGLSGAGMLGNIYTQPAATQVAAANAAYNQPLQNLQGVLTPALGLGALGTNTTGTSTQTPANNPLMNILGGITTGAGLLFSDERLKENIKDVGVLFDGTPVKEYNYVGDDTPQLGMLAQDIERHNPEADAVVEVGGFKAVNYRKATERAANLGRRVGMLEAA
jgi:hypothetical protein